MRVIFFMNSESDESGLMSYAGASFFLLCYSVINPYTFQHVQDTWFPEVLLFLNKKEKKIIYLFYYVFILDASVVS